MAAGVSILSDLPFSPSPGHRRGAGRDMDTANMRIPTAKYTKMGETLRHVIPGHMQCSMACGGKACKYENPSRWSQQEQAIKGLYSSWITDNLLAMARPSTEIIDKYNVIEQFQRCGVKTVINLQRPGEHASCGNALEAESGFTYRPEAFMEAAIYYYNFGWKDYGVASLTTILDMVKVMSFAVQEGKMAVHCHAGLGRTGVLLACYLVFTSRMSADQAILFVRAKRPNSIQTRGQLLCVREFAQFLVPLRSVFSCAEPRAGAVTLSQYLTRQRHLLHGYEARQMKNVPKPVQLLCRLLLDVAADRRAPLRHDWLPAPDLAAELEKTVSQQALQQLGKEMRGKGIHLPLPWSPAGPPGRQPEGPRDQPLVSDSELDPLWRLQHGGGGGALSPSLCAHRALCYSDSALHKLGARRRLMEALRLHKLPISCLIKHSLSHSSLASLAPQDPRPESPSIQKWLQKGPHSLSLDLCDRGRRSPASASPLPPPPAEEESEAELSAAEASEVRSAAEVPCITLQSELSPESRRLLVAKALAMELHDKDLSSKVSHWQAELNSREGAWERLCVERDPLVLSALMWSWLEQLREPVISSEDVRTIRETKVSPHNALDSLDKGHRLTLLCILDCAAHLLPMPEEVETSFLHQTIKMFTKMDALSEKNRCLYAALSSILTPILHELRHKAAAEPSRDCSA